MDRLTERLGQYDRDTHLVFVIDRIRAADLSDEDKRQALRQWAGSRGIAPKSWAMDAVARPLEEG